MTSLADPMIMRFFAYSHLPEHLQKVSKPFHDLALAVWESTRDSDETMVSLRKLLEAKDAAVRGAMPVNRTEKLVAPQAEQDVIQSVATEVTTELRKAVENWPSFNTAHEGFAVLLEEVDELKRHVWTYQKRRDLPMMRREAIQAAAMAMRFALEVCDEETGRK